MRCLRPTLSRSRLSRGFRATRTAQDKLSVEGLASKTSLTGEHVLVRLDLNVPLSKEDGKTITNDKRLRAVVPTLEFLKKQGAKTIIATHIGRCNSKADLTFTYLLILDLTWCSGEPRAGQRELYTGRSAAWCYFWLRNAPAQ